MKITEGKQSRPRRVLIYGDNGIGKSTLAASFPKPLVINLEDGVGGIDVDATERRTELAEVIGDVSWLIQNENPYRTIVIDTADWLEKLIFSEVAKKAGKTTVEEIGYGKGYELVEHNWRRLLNGLTMLWASGRHIIFVCHSKVAKYKNPDGDSYDYHAPAMHDKGSEIVQQWCDEVLFCHYRTLTRTVEEGYGNKRAIAVGGTERFICCQEAATHVAKNRLGMPAEIPMSFEEYAKFLGNINGLVINGSSKIRSEVNV